MFESIRRFRVRAGDGQGGRRAIRWGGLAAAFALGACTVFSKPEATPSRLSPETVKSATEGTAFPNLATVPGERPAVSPPEKRREIMEGLIADRANARYTDEALRPGGTMAPQTAQQRPDIYSISPGAGTEPLMPPEPAPSAPPPAAAPAPAPDTTSPEIANMQPPPTPDLAEPDSAAQAAAAEAPEPSATSSSPSPEAGGAAVETTDLAALPPKPEEGGARIERASILFGAGSAELSAAAQQELVALAEQLARNQDQRIQLVAYASSGEGANSARRLSLSRAVAVRGFLIEKGVSSGRMDVRALGNEAEGAPADRVDIRPAAR